MSARTGVGSVNVCGPGQWISLGKEISELLRLSLRHFLPLFIALLAALCFPSYPGLFWDPSKGWSIVEVAPRRNHVTLCCHQISPSNTSQKPWLWLPGQRNFFCCFSRNLVSCPFPFPCSWGLTALWHFLAMGRTFWRNHFILSDPFPFLPGGISCTSPGFCCLEWC